MATWTPAGGGVCCTCVCAHKQYAQQTSNHTGLDGKWGRKRGKPRRWGRKRRRCGGPRKAHDAAPRTHIPRPPSRIHTCNAWRMASRSPALRPHSALHGTNPPATALLSKGWLVCARVLPSSLPPRHRAVIASSWHSCSCRQRVPTRQREWEHASGCACVWAPGTWRPHG